MRRGTESPTRGFVVDRVPLTSITWNDYRTNQYYILHNKRYDDIDTAKMTGHAFSSRDINGGNLRYLTEGTDGPGNGWNGYAADIGCRELTTWIRNRNGGRRRQPNQPQYPNGGSQGSYGGGNYGGRQGKGMFRSFLDGVMDTVDDATWRHTWTGKQISNAWNAGLNAAREYYQNH